MTHWCKLLVCDLKETKLKVNGRKCVPRRKIWKLHEDSVKSGFSSYVNNYREIGQVAASVEGYWNVLGRTLLEATDKSC